MEHSEKVLIGARVLCVDDCPDSLALLRAVLDNWGALVTTCASAEEAIAMLKKDRFDVLVSDLSMPPGLDGYDLVHALRDMEDKDQDRAVTPSIAVSGDALKPSQKRRFADFQVYMPKPFDSSRLAKILNRLVAADGEAVRLGSLGLWEAKEAAAVAPEIAATRAKKDAAKASAHS